MSGANVGRTQECSEQSASGQQLCRLWLATAFSLKNYGGQAARCPPYPDQEVMMVTLANCETLLLNLEAGVL
ncbi:MAG: hypothetical protein ACI9EB_000390, partial [Pseudomonas sp.]